MAIILTKIKYCYKMSNFYSLGICIWITVLLLMYSSFGNGIYLDSSQIFKILFPPG